MTFLADLEKLTKRWRRGTPEGQGSCVGVAHEARRGCAKEVLELLRAHGLLGEMYRGTPPKPDLSELRTLVGRAEALAASLETVNTVVDSDLVAQDIEMLTNDLTAALDRLERPHTPPRGPEEA